MNIGIQYELERKQIAKQNLEISLKYFYQSIQIAKCVGLDIKNLNLFKNIFSKINPILGN